MASPGMIVRRPGYATAISSSAGIARSSRSMAMTRLAPSASSARVTTGAGPDFDDGAVPEFAGGTCDARSEIEIEQEVLAQLLLGAEPIARDDLTQRRKVVDLAQAPPVRRSATRIAASMLETEALPVPTRSN